MPTEPASGAWPPAEAVAYAGCRWKCFKASAVIDVRFEGQFGINKKLIAGRAEESQLQSAVCKRSLMMQTTFGQSTKEDN